MIPTIIPSTAPTVDLQVIHDDTSLIPTDTPTISPIVPTIPPIAPNIQYTSPFICTDSSDSDTPDIPPSHDPYEILPVPPRLPRQPAVLVLPEQPILVGRPYHTQPNGMTHHEILRQILRQRLHQFLIQTLHLILLQDILHQIPTSSVLVASPVCEALSPVRADLLPPYKRIRDFDTVTNFEPDVDSDIQPDIDACIAFADDIAARGTNVRVEYGTTVEEEAGSSMRGTIKIRVDRLTHPIVSDWIGRLETYLGGIWDIAPRFCSIIVHVAITSFGVVVAKIPTATRTGMTQDAINELIAKRMEEALKAYEATKNPGTETEMENKQQEDNVEAHANNGNGNGNRNGNPNVNNRVKYASCTLLDGALTWWNSHKRTSGVDATYTMTWKALMKIMPKRFLELTLLYTKMVLEEEDQVEKYIGGLPDNIQGNVIVAEPTRPQDAIRIANNLIDQKLKGYC
ncbi:hypothetical protein Tco_0091587 [Tanacetum coccineum]